MDDKRLNASDGSNMIVYGEKMERLCSTYLGVSCVVALRLLTETSKADEKWSEMRDKVILLGLIVWRISDDEKDELFQKLEESKGEIEELKKLRHEDAKANEKVTGIFSSREQNWLNERKKLRLQIEALMKELRVIVKKKKESVSKVQEKLKETEALVLSKDNKMAEAERKRKELEEKLAKAEKEARELRETREIEARELSAELQKQKTAFLELISRQRQLECELGRAIKQNEFKKYELDLALEQQEESMLLSQKLSSEIMKMKKDLEQKDRLLSMMLVKSNLSIAEKQMLLKEVKMSKVTKQKTEQGKEKQRITSESRKLEGLSLRSMFSVKAKSRGASNMSKQRDIDAIDTLELNEDLDIALEIGNSYSADDFNKLGTDGISRKYEKQDCGDEGRCMEVTGKRHHIEFSAFAEQTRLKDEKLKALCWRLMKAELEAKRLRSCIEGLNKEMSQLRHDNMKLEGMVVQQGEESVTFKKQFTSQLKCLMFHKTSMSSKSKNVKREPRGERNTETQPLEVSHKIDAEEEREANSPRELRPLSLNVQSDTTKASEGERLVATKRGLVSAEEIKILEKSSSTSQPLIMRNNPPWRMALHALGISYKIKRLKQQLMMLERYTAKRESKEIDESTHTGKKALLLLLPLLTKQVDRYQSLQEKTDDLCKRMHVRKNRDNIKADAEEETALEHFLEETFQLQRHIVTTGQKLMEIQSKIASGFAAVLEGLTHESSSSFSYSASSLSLLSLSSSPSSSSSSSSSSFDMKRFAESMRSLFQEVQRGLEVRMSRIIGDLEGMICSRRR